MTDYVDTIKLLKVDAELLEILSRSGTGRHKQQELLDEIDQLVRAAKQALRNDR